MSTAATDPRYTPEALARVEARVRHADPLLLQAADEQDLDLLRWHLRLDPLERLRAAWDMAHALGQLRPQGR